MRTFDELDAVLSAEADDVCTGTELMERLRSQSPPPRRRLALAVAAGVAVAVTAGVILAVRPDTAGRPSANTAGSTPSVRATTSSTDNLTGQSRLRRVRLSYGASVLVPARWYREGFHGLPSTLGAPDIYLSTEPMGAQCTARSTSTCVGSNWFPASWVTPEHGALMVWSTLEYPTAAKEIFVHLPGRRIRIDGRPAKIYRGPTLSGCVNGADSEIDAYVQDGRLNASGPRLDLAACLGDEATSQDRRDVISMIESLKFGS